MLQTQLRELSLAVWGRLPEALWLRLLDSLPLLERLEVGGCCWPGRLVVAEAGVSPGATRDSMLAELCCAALF